MAQVQFKKGLFSDYKDIDNKSADTLYFCTDTQQIFMGETEYTRPVLSGEGAPGSTVPSSPRDIFYFDTKNKNLYVSLGGNAWVMVVDGGANDALQSAIGTVTSDLDTLSERVDANEDAIEELKSTITGLSGAMHFRGAVSADPTKTAPTLNPAAAAGDVVVFGAQEYVYDGSAWKLFGDEGSYALKDQVAADIADAKEDIETDYKAADTATLNAAKSDAATKASTAKSEAIAAAKTETESQVSAAKSELNTAISNGDAATLASAKADATTKADAALESAKTYTDTQISTQVTAALEWGTFEE